MRLRAAVAGDVGVIAAKDQRNLFQLRLRADYEIAKRWRKIDLVSKIGTNEI